MLIQNLTFSQSAHGARYVLEIRLVVPSIVVQEGEFQQQLKFLHSALQSGDAVRIVPAVHHASVPALPRKAREALAAEPEPPAKMTWLQRRFAATGRKEGEGDG